jgi:hypothetical protein
MNFKIIAKNVDVKPLVDSINTNPELWDQINTRTAMPNSPHEEASDIVLRFHDLTGKVLFDTEGPTAEGVEIYNSLENVWYYPSELLPVKPYIYALMQDVCGERLGRAVITRLKPGAEVHWHMDQGAPVDYYQRFHIALQSAPGQDFIIEDGEATEVFNAQTGDVFLLANHKNHCVINNSNVDRLTMIIDIQTPLFNNVKVTSR